MERRHTAVPARSFSPAARSAAKTRRLNARLIDASADGDVETVRDLLRVGANVNCRNRKGETPLSYAATWNHPTVVKLLLRHRANPNATDAMGGTALMWAAQHGSPQIVSELLKHGADPRAVDRAGHSVLMHAEWRTRQRAQVTNELKKYLTRMNGKTLRTRSR